MINFLLFKFFIIISPVILVNCFMNNKNTYFNQNKLIVSSKLNLSSPKTLKVNQKSKTKHSNKLKSPNLKNNIKNQQNQQKIITKTKSPPLLKRQNTEQSPQIIKKTKNIKESSQWPESNLHNNKRYRHNLGDGIKIQSDEQSTNVYHNCKQSADEDQNPYRIGQQKLNKKQKEKSIQPSRDFSITLMRTNQKNDEQKLEGQRQNSEQYSQSCTSSQRLTLRQLKQSLKTNLQSFKSLSKFHQQQNQYFINKGHITKDEQKRLKKIHSIEKNNLKQKIYQLKEQMDQRLKTKNLI